MHPLESLIGLITWAGKNTAYNLEFIPVEKLAWKPAPTANSALEIVAHVCGAIRSMEPALTGGEWAPPSVPVPTSLEEAQSLLASSVQGYAAALRQVSPADLGRTIIAWGGMSIPLARAASMPVVDLIHHHGQIAYIQALLGDTAFHFYEEKGG